ncbi:MAG: tetratricopeptide repeat protein [Candidatus Kapaibacterium sp.]
MEIYDDKITEQINTLAESAENAKKRGNWPEVEQVANTILAYFPLHQLDIATERTELFTQESYPQIAHAFRLLSESNWRRGTFGEAKAYAERAIEFARPSGNHSELIQCLSNMGTVLEKMREYQNARQMYDQALALSHEHGDRTNAARITGNIGILHLSTFEYQEALAYFMDALRINTELGRKDGMARNLGNIGIVYYSLGEHYKALDYYQQALEIERQLGRNDGISQNLSNLGTVCVEIADYTKALTYLRAALEIHEATGSHFKGHTLCSISLVFTRLREFSKALDYAQSALEASRVMNDQYLEATVYTNIANTYMAQNDYSPAEMHLRKALCIYEKLHSQSGIALILGNLGNLHGARGENTQALDFMERSVDLYLDIGYLSGAARNLANSGLIYADEKYSGYDSAKAEKLLTKAIALDEESGTKGQSIEPLKKLAMIYERDGRLREALDCTKKLYQIEVEIERAEAQKQAQQFHYERKIVEIELRGELDRLAAEAQRREIEHTVRLQRDELERSIARLVEKNKFLSSIIAEMREVGRYARGEGSLKTDELIEKIRRNIASMESLGTLEQQMNDVHRDFIRHIRELFPTLTPMEVKIAVLLKMNLTSPNIASLLFISHRTVEVHRAHIRKKMGLKAMDNMYYELGKL